MIETIGREEFIRERFAYASGEHVTFLAPTTAGKTTLAYSLLSQVGTPTLPAISLVMKPKDPVVRKWAKTLGYKIVRHWPPITDSPFSPSKPPGYVLWPKHTYDPDQDDPKHYIEFRKAILGSYKKGGRILFADETMGLTQLGLANECITVWSRGASMGCGLWAATQKPSHIPLWAYGNAHHLFLGYDPDKRNRDRFSEIGGVDPDLVKNTVVNLGPFQWLYIRRKPRAMCIVDKN